MSNASPQTGHLEATRWKPGQSGNPAGKPRGARHITTIVQQLLEKPGSSLPVPNAGTPVEAIVQVMILKALDGDVRAFDALIKAGYGRVAPPPIMRPDPKPILGGISVMPVEMLEEII